MVTHYKNKEFLFITHDLPFALSVGAEKFILVKAEDEYEVIDNVSALFPSIAEEIIGAASLSVTAKTFVFCEGGASSYDFELFDAWHGDDLTVVIPVGSCEKVRDCVVSFQSTNIIANIQCMGYVDRDFCPWEGVTLPQNVTLLPVHEVEGLFYIEDIFSALYLFYERGSKSDAIRALRSALTEIQRSKSESEIFKVAFDRAKVRFEIDFRIAFNSLKFRPSREQINAEYAARFSDFFASSNFTNLFNEELETVRGALNGRPDDFLKIFPSKPLKGKLLSLIEVIFEKIFKDTCNSLKYRRRGRSDNSKLAVLGDELRVAFSKFLNKTN